MVTKVLTCDPAQYQTLQGYTDGVNTIEFTVDANGNYIIGTTVRDSGAFPAVQTVLDALPEIDHVPVVEQE